MATERTNQNDNNEGKTEQDVDKGYSWIILTGCFFIHLFAIGSMKCLGVLQAEMLDHFTTTLGKTAWITSISWSLLLIIAPLTVILAKRFSFRLVAFAGGILVWCGYFLSGFVQEIELMYLTFTVVGFGYGLSDTSSATIVNFYFKKRRTLANGIVVSSGGIAVLTFPFLYRFLIDKYGLSQTFWIIGAILSNICVACCIFRQPTVLLNRQKTTLSENDRHGENKSVNICHSLKMKFSLFKNRRFTLLVIALALCSIGHSNNYTLIPVQIKALGYSNTYVSTGVSVTGGAELIGRILIGWFADLNVIKKINIFAMCSFVGGAFALITPFFESFTFMAVYSGVAGAFPASFHALLSVLAIERVGLEHYPTAFAVISVFRALAMLVSMPLFGWLADYNLHSSFIFVGITFICAGVIALLDKVAMRFDTNKNDITTSLEHHIYTLENGDIRLDDGEQ